MRLFNTFVYIVLIGIVFSVGYLQFHKGETFSVQTGSMEPSIRVGDLVVVNSVPDYVVGDVITFTQSPGQIDTVTHRIVGINENGTFVTRGDANASADQKSVSRANIIGRVDTTIPYAGYLFGVIATPLGILLAVYIPALWIVGDEVRRLAKYYKAQMAWRDPKFESESAPKQPTKKASSAIGLSISLIVVLGVGAPLIAAALNDQATLEGNTMISAQLDGGSGGGDDDCNSISLDASVSTSSSASTNTTNVDASVDTDQEATSGDASNTNNTGGGSAQTGDASNCRSTTINIDISN